MTVLECLAAADKQVIPSVTGIVKEIKVAEMKTYKSGKNAGSQYFMQKYYLHDNAGNQIMVKVNGPDHVAEPNFDQHIGQTMEVTASWEQGNKIGTYEAHKWVECWSPNITFSAGLRTDPMGDDSDIDAMLPSGPTPTQSDWANSTPAPPTARQAGSSNKTSELIGLYCDVIKQLEASGVGYDHEVASKFAISLFISKNK